MKPAFVWTSTKNGWNAQNAIWSRALWLSATKNLRKAKQWSKSVLTFDRCRPHSLTFGYYQSYFYFPFTTLTPLWLYIDPTSTLPSTYIFNTALWIVKLCTPTTNNKFLLLSLQHHHYISFVFPPPPPPPPPPHFCCFSPTPPAHFYCFP